MAAVASPDEVDDFWSLLLGRAVLGESRSEGLMLKPLLSCVSCASDFSSEEVLLTALARLVKDSLRPMPRPLKRGIDSGMSRGMCDRERIVGKGMKLEGGRWEVGSGRWKLEEGRKEVGVGWKENSGGRQINIGE